MKRPHLVADFLGDGGWGLEVRVEREGLREGEGEEGRVSFKDDVACSRLVMLTVSPTQCGPYPSGGVPNMAFPGPLTHSGYRGSLDRLGGRRSPPAPLLEEKPGRDGRRLRPNGESEVADEEEEAGASSVRGALVFDDEDADADASSSRFRDDDEKERDADDEDAVAQHGWPLLTAGSLPSLLTRLLAVDLAIVCCLIV